MDGISKHRIVTARSADVDPVVAFGKIVGKLQDDPIVRLIIGHRFWQQDAIVRRRHTGIRIDQSVVSRIDDLYRIQRLVIEVNDDLVRCLRQRPVADRLRHNRDDLCTAIQIEFDRLIDAVIEGFAGEIGQGSRPRPDHLNLIGVVGERETLVFGIV